MLVTTTHDIAGKRIVKTLGLVRGNTIRARNLGHDFMAGLKNIVGGEIVRYIIDSEEIVAVKFQSVSVNSAHTLRIADEDSEVIMARHVKSG